MIDPTILVACVFVVFTLADLVYAHASRSSVSSPHKTCTSLVHTEPENLEEPAREYWSCLYCGMMNDMEDRRCDECGVSRRSKGELTEREEA